MLKLILADTMYCNITQYFKYQIKYTSAQKYTSRNYKYFNLKLRSFSA